MKFEEILKPVEHFAKARGISSISNCSLERSSKTDRRVYQLGDEFVAKLFAPEARDRYEREHCFLGLDIGHERRPELVDAAFDATTGGYIVMTVLSGRMLSEVHQDMSAAEYTDIAGDLGACMAGIHSVSLAKVSRLPPSGLEAQRRRHFAAFAEKVDHLERAHILPAKSVPVLIDAVSAGQALAFASPRKMLHADVHNTNVFVRLRNGRWSCALIDFEDSAPGFAELDFVFPFLIILGEAFPGRRLAASWKRIWRSFAEGYATLAGAEPDLDLIVAHALAWYLWLSVDCLESDHPVWHPKHREFAQVALEALAVRGTVT